jgi:hypothetical protein
MQPPAERVTDADAVFRQAADVATEAVQASAMAALRAADGCGCRGCRARAAQTIHWAIAMMADTAETSAVATPSLQARW